MTCDHQLPDSPRPGHLARRGIVAFAALIVAVLVAAVGLATPTATAAPLAHAPNAVAAIPTAVGQRVGPHEPVLPGQGRARAPGYHLTAVGSCVGANSVAAGGGGPDFVAGPIGSEPPVPVSQSRMAAGFDDAGFPSMPTASPGTEYTLPDGTKVRLMEPSGQAPMRASFTNGNGGPINPFTGKPVQPPAPPGWSMKDWVRALTHVEQTP